MTRPDLKDNETAPILALETGRPNERALVYPKSATDVGEDGLVVVVLAEVFRFTSDPN